MCVGRFTPDAGEARDFDPPLDGLFIFSCSTVIEMKPNDVVRPRNKHHKLCFHLNTGDVCPPINELDSHSDRGLTCLRPSCPTAWIHALVVLGPAGP
jgi:hypothetical protein